MDIQACPRCGSRDLNMPKFDDGSVPGTDNRNQYVCGKCGLKAIPIAFDDYAHYDDFRQALA